jgi:hypothetical protein
MGTRRRAGLPYFDPGRYWCKARYRYRLRLLLLQAALPTALYLTAEPGTGSGCSEVGVGRTLEGRYLTVECLPQVTLRRKKWVGGMDV